MSQVVAGKYELLRRLGKGGMAEVFLARQRGLDGFEKLVVVKRILPQLAGDEEFTTMFLDEARTAADLRHPNVVTIFEVGEDEGTYYMAMEFLHGHDIRRIQRQAVKQDLEIPIEHALQIVIDAAAGLHHAHTKTDLSGRRLNIVHRDVSPQNILCTFDGATKIVDFGIAKAASQSTETQTGVVKGKYTYMAPEQAQGEDIDARTDQYALGIVLWELLTMRRLFKRENDLATLNAVTNGDVPPPNQFAKLDDALNDIVVRSLSYEKDERFGSCEDFALALEDYLVDKRLPHSPARLGGFLREIFAEELEAEKQLGIGHSDGESLSQSAGPKTSVGRKKGPRSRTGDTPVADPGDAKAAGAPDPLPRPPVGSGDFDEAIPTAGDDDSRADTTQASGPPEFSQPVEATPPTPRERKRPPLPPRNPAPSSSGLTRFDDPTYRRRVILAGALTGLAFVAVAVPVAWFVAQPATGVVVVRSDPPNAAILLDGKPVDKETPDKLPKVTEGAHQLTLHKPGYLTKTVDIEVREGQELKVNVPLTAE